MVKFQAQVKALGSTLFIILCTMIVIFVMSTISDLTGIYMFSGMYANIRKRGQLAPISSSSTTKPIESTVENSRSSITSPNSCFPNPINKFIRCDDDKEIRIIHLVMMWPPGYCITARTCWPDIEMTRFYIHGLWPADENGNHILGCSLRFDPIDIPQRIQNFGAEMTHRLNVHWPSYERNRIHRTRSEASLTFWKHEYLKHGSCTDLSLEEYFRRGVDIGGNLKIEDWLLAAGLLSNSSHTRYTKQELLNALSPYNEGKNLYVSCKGGGRIVEIVLCLDIEAHGIITCPNIIKNFGCEGSEVTFYKDTNFLDRIIADQKCWYYSIVLKYMCT